MRFALYLPVEGPFADVGLLAELAADAESAGWDGFFLWDELLPIYEHSDPVRAAVGESGDVADASIALTAVAAATGRIRFGTMVTPVARLRPEQFARQTATLDRFSGGRLTIGVGLGNPPDQFSAFGGVTDLRTRAAMVDEFLDVLVQLWSGRPVEFRGTHYTVTGVTMTPRPQQEPRIPIWIGADSHHRAPRRRAARWDGFVPASDGWPDDVIPPEQYEAMRADLGRRDDFDLAVIGSADGTRPSPASLPAYQDAGVTWVLAQALTVDAARRRIAKGPPGDGVTRGGEPHTYDP